MEFGAHCHWRQLQLMHLASHSPLLLVKLSDAGDGEGSGTCSLGRGAEPSWARDGALGLGPECPLTSDAVSHLLWLGTPIHEQQAETRLSPWTAPPNPLVAPPSWHLPKLHQLLGSQLPIKKKKAGWFSKLILLGSLAPFGSLRANRDTLQRALMQGLVGGDGEGEAHQSSFQARGIVIAPTHDQE